MRKHGFYKNSQHLWYVTALMAFLKWCTRMKNKVSSWSRFENSWFLYLVSKKFVGGPATILLNRFNLSTNTGRVEIGLRVSTQVIRSRPPPPHPPTKNTTTYKISLTFFSWFHIVLSFYKGARKCCFKSANRKSANSSAQSAIANLQISEVCEAANFKTANFFWLTRRS
jgi:hypothetical protein